MLIEILEGHDNLYLKYLLLGEIKAKAKIWGDSKKDLLKSIEIFPIKEHIKLINGSIEEETTYDKQRIKAWQYWQKLSGKIMGVPILFDCQTRLEYLL